MPTRSRVRCWGMVLFLLLNAAMARAESNWPRWRGPAGNGHTSETNLPTTWTADSCAWKLPMKGLGQSSPIIWGERIFLTTALEYGNKRIVFCVDRNNGKVLWEEQVPWAGEPEKNHRMNSHATASCVTDGETVIAFFGRAGIHAYSVEGKHLWSRNLGQFVSPWGTSASPVIVDDLVIQNGDADEGAFIIGLNKKTGATVWRTNRPNHRGWSTPVLVKVKDHRELVLNGHAGVTAYDPSGGDQLWFCKSFSGRGTPTVTPGDGLLYTVNGLSGDIYAITPGGSGDVTGSHMAWHTPRRGGRDLPSPILIGKHLLVVNMKGVLTCYDSQSGKELWQDRIAGNYSSSPIAVAGKAYFLNEEGESVVIQPGKELNIVSRNPLSTVEGEIFRASLTPSEGQIFVRSHRMLYCVGKRRR